jgi:hypothetical protein
MLALLGAPYLLVGQMAVADDRPTPSFALISPEAAAKPLSVEKTSAIAQKILAAAEKAVARDPMPLPNVHTEGTLPHQGIWDQSIKAEADWGAMLNLALAWQITPDPRYLQAEDKYLTAWTDVYQISFNPIDETNLDQLILAFDLTQSQLPDATRQKVHQFLQTIAQGYLQRIQAKKDKGNWQSHRIKLATLAAYALGDESLITRAQQAFFQHVAENIQPDGSTYDFHLRDALHYTVYDLEPLTMAALAAKAHGQDWFHPSAPGQPSLSAALDWLVPYASGEKTHEEFVHSPIKFDAQRAQAGEKGYSGLWVPATSLYLWQLASVFNPAYDAIIAQLVQGGAHPHDWPTLLLQAGN